MAAPKKHPTEEARLEARRAAGRKYAASEKGRAAAVRNNASPLAKERTARYRNTVKYTAAQQRRASKGRSEYQLAYKRSVLQTHPERLHARAAVYNALRRGDITRPPICAQCGATNKPHAHHHLGYEPDKWLDVEWLCTRCHQAAHT